jgi:hypothetical protein
MDLLATIQREVLRQQEEEAVNLFSWVVDFREFILNTRPATDVVVSIKMRCLDSRRLQDDQGTRVMVVDRSALFEPTASALNQLTPSQRKPFIAQIIVWDAKPPRTSVRGSKMEFRPGTVYKFHQVELVSIYDGVAQGSVRLEDKQRFKVRQVGAHLKPRMKGSLW